jgi:CheY-like chemotaxis protein
LTRSRRILLVEDNPDDVLLTRRAFQRSGLEAEILLARDGQEALDLLLGGTASADHEPIRAPDLVLLDLKLPRVSGFEVLRRLRGDARTRRTPVVILTSSKEDRDLISTYDLGANSFVRKPVDFDQFAAAARHIGVYWLEVNEVAPPERPDLS